LGAGRTFQPKRSHGRKHQPRRLTTIVAMDVGYSARIEADETRTTAEVAALRSVIERIAVMRGGRVFNTAGDGFMLEFGSSLAAVEAAGALADIANPSCALACTWATQLCCPNGDLLGHGVNVAARLMAQSDPCSVLVSADVHRTIRGPLAARLVSQGIFQLDKMTGRIEAFALLGEEPADPKSLLATGTTCTD
jgi:class 3 adenylate cyclase